MYYGMWGWATGAPLSILSGCATWPDDILLAVHPCDWPLGARPKDIWLLVNSRITHSLSLFLGGGGAGANLWLPPFLWPHASGQLRCFVWPAPVSSYWLCGRGCSEVAAVIAADNCRIIQRSQSVTARWLVAMHEALSAVTYQGSGVIQL